MTSTPLREHIPTRRGVAADKPADPRRLAWAMTMGAAAFALVLGAVVPARAAGPGAVATPPGVPAAAFGADVDQMILPARKKKGPRHTSTIPAVCALEFDTGRRRSFTVFPERCLRREGVAGRLPRACASEARLWGKRERVYSADCLREAGFGIERPRRGWHDRRDN